MADVVALHLSRLQRYIERYHSYLDSPLKHVYLTGDPEAVERARQKFAKLKQFDVEVLNPADLEHGMAAHGRRARHQPGRRAWARPC